MEAEERLETARHLFTPDSGPMVIEDNVGWQISHGIDPLTGRPLHFIAVVRKPGIGWSVSYDECKLSYDETEILGISHKLQKC